MDYCLRVTKNEKKGGKKYHLLISVGTCSMSHNTEKETIKEYYINAKMNQKNHKG